MTTFPERGNPFRPVFIGFACVYAASLFAFIIWISYSIGYSTRRYEVTSEGMRLPSVHDNIFTSEAGPFVLTLKPGSSGELCRPTRCIPVTR